VSAGVALAPALKKEEKERTLFASLERYYIRSSNNLLDAHPIFRLHPSYA
jgi:hypothetical protein